MGYVLLNFYTITHGLITQMNLGLISCYGIEGFLSTRHVYTMLLADRHTTNGNDTTIETSHDYIFVVGANSEMPVAPHRVMPVFGTKVEMGKRPINQVLASKYGAFRK